MAHTRDASPQHLAQRVGGQAARRDDARGARRRYRQPVVDGGERRHAGALLDACCPGLQELGGIAGLNAVRGTAGPRGRVPCVPDVVRSGRKPLAGGERMTARPALLGSEEGLRRLAGFTARQGRPGACQRGAATRQGPRTEGPIGPDPWAAHRVARHRHDGEALFQGVIRALATTGAVAAQVTGRVEAPELETTARDGGGGHVTRKRRRPATRGQVPERAVTV